MQGLLVLICIWGGTLLTLTPDLFFGFILLFVGGMNLGYLILAAEKGDKK